MVDKYLPLPPLSKPVRCGCPWHGAVRNTTMTIKASGATMTWPFVGLDASNFRSELYSPTGEAGTYYPRKFWEADRMGFTSRLKFDGGTGGLAPDASTGQHWMREALMSGPQRQIYGHDFSPTTHAGWLWQRDDGTRWIVESDLDEQAEHVWTTPLTVNFVFRPFGGFAAGSGPANESAAVTISDFGHSTASPPPYYEIIGIDYPTTSEDYHRIWLTVVDVSAKGRYAIVEVASTEVRGDTINWLDDPSTHHISPYERAVLGYLQIDLGAPDNPSPVAASVSVLKRRENVYGTYSMHFYSDLPDYRGRIMRACFDRLDRVVYFEFRLASSTITHMEGKWVRVLGDGTELDSVSVTFNDPASTGRTFNYLTKYENYFRLDSTGSLIRAMVWSNNLVGFWVNGAAYPGDGTFLGTVMTADGPATVANVPATYAAQAFGSYSPLGEMAAIAQRVIIGETIPVCWV